MIELELVIQILLGAFVIGGGIISFFVMQKGQNMKIEQLQEEIKEIKRKQSDMGHYQIVTEKAIVEINANIKHILESIQELKK